MVALIEATGKYMLYKAMLEVLELSYPLFLAIPHAAYEAIFSIPSARQLAKNAQLKFLIFDPQEEVIVQWIP